ncbi:MAG TPA: hypothetical protein VE595_04525 [Nitrososphaeraceae archaeon]|jgi:hypothetical protein|nr:hypothetical protein [Nitrososphaeraceae archaeon]HYZ96173.1 hypothetical protein [Nitrososphaeraceae archaeon]
MGVILWMIAIILFLAIIGLGWETFFAGVLKGVDKIGVTPVIKNITDSTKESLKGVLSDSSRNTIENTLNYNT